MRRALPLLATLLVTAGCAQILDYRDIEEIPADGASAADEPAAPPRSDAPASPDADAPAPMRVPRATTCGEDFPEFCDDFERTTSLPSAGWQVRERGGSAQIETQGANRVLAAAVAAPPTPGSLALVALRPPVLAPRPEKLAVTFRVQHSPGIAAAIAEIELAGGSIVRVAVTALGNLAIDELAAGAPTTAPTVTADPVLRPGEWAECLLELDRENAVVTLEVDGSRELIHGLLSGEDADVNELRLGQMPIDQPSLGGALRFDDVGVDAEED